MRVIAASQRQGLDAEHCIQELGDVLIELRGMATNGLLCKDLRILATGGFDITILDYVSTADSFVYQSLKFTR